MSKLKRQILFFSNANFLTIILSFFNAMLLIRLLGAELYGKYSYLNALVAIVPTLFSFADTTIVRFLGSSSLRIQKAIFATILKIKLSLMVFSMAVFLTWYLYFVDSKTSEIMLGNHMFYYAFMAIILLVPINLGANSFIAVLNSLEKYKEVAAINIFRQLPYLLVLIFLWLFRASQDTILAWVILYLVVSTLLLFLYSIYCLDKIGWIEQIRCARPVRHSFYYVYKRYFKSYTQPRIMGVLFQFAKQHLPTIVLGQSFSFESVSYYKVFKNIFGIIERFIPKIADTFLPSIVKYRDISREMFDKKYCRYSIIYIAIFCLYSIVVMDLYLALFQLLQIEHDNMGFSLIVLLFGVNLSFAALNYICNYLFFLESDISHFYISSFLSNSTYILLLIFLVQYGITGILTAELSRQISWMVISGVWSLRKKNMSVLHYSKIYVATIFSVLIISFNYFIIR